MNSNLPLSERVKEPTSVNSNSEQLKKINRILSKYGIAFILVGMVIVMTILKPNTFPTGKNILNILNQSAIVGVMALGMTLVIISRGIDISVGSVLALAGAVAASLSQTEAASIKVFENLGPLPVVFPILAAIAVGMIAGLVSGGFIAYTGIPAFISTLGMMTIARGFVYLYTGGQPISKLSDGMLFFGSNVFGVIPVPVIVYAIMIVVTYILLGHTRFGKSVYAIGSNLYAAEVSGIKVKRNIMFIYMFAGITAAIASILFVGRVASVHPGAASGYELTVIAATTIGGTSHSGGIGTIWGAVLGTVLLSVLTNGFTLLGIDPYWQQIVQGGIIIGAVVLDMRKNAKKA
jgi:inositol transport system permease protein